MNQETTNPEIQTVRISQNVNFTIESKRIVVLLLVFYFFIFLFSSLLLDTVLPNPGWRCHPADSSHVGELWRNHLLFAFPLAGQKHLLTVPPHHHIPKVFKNNIKKNNNNMLWKVTRFDEVSFTFLPGYQTRSTWEPS